MNQSDRNTTSASRPLLRRSALAVAHALALGLLAAAGSAQAAEPPAQAQAAARKSYAIPAGELEAVLNRFGRESGTLLSFPAALTAGLQSEGLSGAYTVPEALQQLLRGTGLAPAAQANGSYTLVKRSEASNAAPEATLPQVTVNGVAESATGPAGGYLARRSASATKTDTPIIETPQAIAIITAEQLAVLKPTSLGAAVAYTPGIVADAGYSNSFDVFYSRGFRLSDSSGGIYRDGLKFGGAGWASGQQETYGLERIELIKGAASVLYGAAAPGGVLNTVTKRPGADMVNEVRASTGTLGRRELAADLGGAMGAEWSWRVTGVARNDGTHIDHIPNNARYFAPALKWQPSAGTSLTLMAYLHERRTAYQYPLPAEGTLLASPYGKLPRGRFIGEPDFDRQDARQHGLSYLFEHAFSGQTRLRHGVRYLASKNHVQFTGLEGADENNPRLQLRAAYDEWERTSGISSDTSLEHRWNAGGLAHTTLAGIDYARHKPESQWSLASIGALDIFAPMYGAKPDEMTLVAPYSTRAKATRTGLYVQDQMKHGERWVFLLGGRHDWARDAKSPLIGTPSWSSESSEAFTGRAGAVYLADHGIAPFASFSQSFEPQSGTDAAGARFKPTRGEQLELGLRWQVLDTGLLLSASAYRLTQQNVVTSDPRQPALRLQTGEVRSEGVELEAKGRLNKHVNVIASYAYTDARTTKSLRANEIGMRQPSVPKHQAALWTDVSLAGVGLNGMKAGLGARYTGTTIDVRGTDAKVPANTVLDALLGYESGNWHASLNFSNLANRSTLSCNYGSCAYGEGRRVTATVGYLW
jgi:iron complex outermembrane receptor protein